MNANVLKKLLHHEPFRPFTVHLDDGNVHEVRYPDQGMIYEDQLIVSSEKGLIRCAMMNIAHVKMEPVVQA